VSSDVSILVSVYHPYRWTAFFTHELIEKYWPDHPPLFFCGLTPEEAGTLPHIPVGEPALPRVWGHFVLEACRELKKRGFTKTYFLLEDHPPLAPCHQDHLNRTLPGLLDGIPASYIGLMGWDNRRFVTKAPITGPHRFMHLTVPRAPRFHLHPSLFRLDALMACLELLIRHDKPTPWGFEKICDKPDADLPEEFKKSCYQICGEELALHPPGPVGRLGGVLERFFYHRMMNLYAPLNRLGLGMKFWDGLGFDDFFYNGPLPMFYSGIMSRGRVNPFFLRYLQTKRAGEEVFQRLIAEARTQGAI
jgi:hypothetical protein